LTQALRGAGAEKTEEKKRAELRFRKSMPQRSGCIDLFDQDRQVALNSFPNALLIDQQISVGNPVAYSAHFREAHFRMQSAKFLKTV
jgi:hypothetical protein